MQFTSAIAMTFALVSAVSAQFPLGGLGGGCNNQNGLINAAILTSANCYGNGFPGMNCGNQGGNNYPTGILGGILGSNALANVNAPSTTNCYKK